jgi:hypothetical protein
MVDVAVDGGTVTLTWLRVEYRFPLKVGSTLILVDGRVDDPFLCVPDDPEIMDSGRELKREGNETDFQVGVGFLS